MTYFPPLISLIVPLYNSEKYLSETIESVINQSYQNWELIIVDDHSTDNSYNLAENFTKKDKRIKLVKRPSKYKKGANSCRNLGLNLAKGKYVIFIDSDDILTPYCIDQRVTSLEKNQNLDFGIFPALSFNDRQDKFNSEVYGYNWGDKKTINNLINKCLPFITWCLLFNRNSLIEKNIKWDENLLSNQDADFNITCLINGLTYKYFSLPPDYLWRQTPGSIWHKMEKPYQAESHIYYFNKLYTRFGKDKNIESDLLLASFFLIKKIMLNNKSIINKFLSNKFFKNRLFYKIKIKLLYNLHLIGNNRRKNEIIYFLFFPILSLKQRNKDRNFPFKRSKIIINKILINQYYKSI